MRRKSTLDPRDRRSQSEKKCAGRNGLKKFGAREQSARSANPDAAFQNAFDAGRASTFRFLDDDARRTLKIVMPALTGFNNRGRRETPFASADRRRENRCDGAFGKEVRRRPRQRPDVVARRGDEIRRRLRRVPIADQPEAVENPPGDLEHQSDLASPKLAQIGSLLPAHRGID